jgi:hypothetical protein
VGQLLQQSKVMRFRLPKALRTWALVFLLTPLLGSCYLPTDFEFLVQVAGDGRYVLSYKGQLTSVGIAKSLRSGETTEKEAAEKIQKTQLGLLKKNPGFKSVVYEGQGRFLIDYESSGSVQRHRYVTFVDGTSKFLIIKYLEKEGTVTVTGDKMKDQFVRELINMGLRPSGTLRIRTDAKVLEHNAEQVRGKRTREYVWNIKGFRGAPPKFVMELRRPVAPL